MKGLVEILQGVRGRLVWDESETVSSFDRWSFGERRTKRLLSYGLKLNFIDSSVKERGDFLVFGFPRVARPDVYFEEY